MGRAALGNSDHTERRTTGTDSGIFAGNTALGSGRIDLAGQARTATVGAFNLYAESRLRPLEAG